MAPSEAAIQDRRQDVPFGHTNTGLSPTLGAMAQKMIGKHDSHHRFADGNGANADAGIVTAFRADIGFAALSIDRSPRRQD